MLWVKINKIMPERIALVIHHEFLILTVPKILIVAATKFELKPLLDRFNISINMAEGLFKPTSGSMDVSVLITGVGMVNTAFNLGKYLNVSYNYIINIGICGAFDRNLKIGEIVNVAEDCLSEMGAQDDLKFIKFSELGLGGSNCYSNHIKTNYAPFRNLKKVKGITVNTVHGNEESIKKTISLFTPDVESMEGAAFFRACENMKANYFQLRAVSNYVEKREKSNWNIPLAIQNVNEFTIKLIENLNQN